MMLYSARIRRIGVMLLSANALLVCAAAVLEHATADESGPPASTTPSDNAAASPSSDELPVSNPPTIYPPTTAPRTTTPPTRTAPTTTPSSPRGEAAVEGALDPDFSDSGSRLSRDPVLDELRKLVRDPDSGLNAEPIPIPSLGSRKPASSAAASGWSKLKRRTESVYRLSTAAHALSEEAQTLAEAGQNGEAELIMQQVAQLHAMIARLAAPK